MRTSTRHQSWLTFLLLTFLIFGCGSSTPKIHFQISDDFSGDFVIVKNDGQGIVVPRKDDKYIIKIPKNGILRIKSYVPFDQWHTVSASFLSGKTIPYGHEGTVPNDGKALWFVANSNTKVWYFLGTKKEFDKVDFEDLKLFSEKNE